MHSVRLSSLAPATLSSQSLFLFRLGMIANVFPSDFDRFEDCCEKHQDIHDVPDLPSLGNWVFPLFIHALGLRRNLVRLERQNHS